MLFAIELTIVLKANDDLQFHRGEYTVKQVKDHLQQQGFLVRQFEAEI